MKVSDYLGKVSINPPETVGAMPGVASVSDLCIAYIAVIRRQRGLQALSRRNINVSAESADVDGLRDAIGTELARRGVEVDI